MNNAPPTQSQAPDDQHRAKERQYWTWQTFIGICAVVISVLAVGITAAGFYVLLQTLSATRDAVAEAHRQAQAAEAQTIIAKNALIASNRPWIKLVEAKVVSMTVAPRDISTMVDFVYRNVGHSPAERIRVGAELVIGDLFGYRARAICVELGSRPGGDIDEKVVFPNEVGSTRTGFGIMMRDIIAERQERLRQYNETQKQMPPEVGWFPLNKVDSTVDLWVSGCVEYKLYGFSDIHTTGFNLSVKVITSSMEDTRHKFRMVDTDHLRAFKAGEIILDQGVGGSFAD